MPHRFQLFGAPALLPDAGEGAAPIALPFERRGQLMVLLALRRAWVPRTEIANLLWPDQTDKLAAANLRKTLFRMQGVEWCAALQSEAGALRVEAEVDVHEFEQALRDGRAPDALALYRGALLSGFDDDDNEAWTDWLHFERRRLQTAWRAAVLDHLAAEPDAPDAGALCARLLEHDPLDEAALRLQMSLLGRQGQAARAHEAFRAFSQRLRDELDLAPGAELQSLHEAIGGAALARTALPEASPPADPGEAGFVGRAGERRRIGELLGRDGVRLLNLLGPGGIGKTRLAERAAHDLAASFPDGSFLVRLEDANDAGEWVARIARETGTTLRGRATPLEQLCAALRERRMLLVFDNVEQLVEAAAAVIDPLLAGCPGIAMLLTSRVRLGLAGEQLLPLEGLPCPEREDTDLIESFDAARLFIAAARRVEPGLLPSAEAPAIVEICRLVDGMPLALELAAAWTRVLSCDAIVDALREGSGLLRASDASRPARHASIEQVFEQSWQRLGAAEREALAALSVFQGGFGAEAARAVTGASLPVLGALADKSLLRKEGTRLLLHPLVQQFAHERLEPAAGQQARRAHMNYFRLGLARLTLAIRRGERAALDAIEAEMENHLHAWRWAVSEGAVAAVREIGAALQGFFDHRGPFVEGLALLRQAIDAPTLREPSLQAWLVGEAAQFEYRLDRYPAAMVLAQSALDSSDRTVRQRARGVLGTCALRQGRFSEARRHFKQSLALMDPGSEERVIAGTLDHLSLVEKYLGHFDDAQGFALDALARYRRLGDPAGLALCLNNLGALYMAREDYRTGLPHLHEALALCEREGLPGTLPFVLSNLSEVEMHCDNLMAARGHAQRAGEIAQANGNRAARAWATLQIGRIDQRGGEHDAARKALAEGLADAIAIGLPTLHCIAVVAFAELLCAQDDDRISAARVLGFAARQPTMGGMLGQSMSAERQRMGLPDDRVPLPIDFAELLRRIAAEASVGHVALRELLHRAERRRTARA